MENIDKINSFETSVEDLRSVVVYRANKLQKHFGYKVPPYPEELLTVLGDMNIDMGQPKKAKMYLDFSLEYYPNSEHAHATLAKYYEVQGDTKKALETLQQAAKLGNAKAYADKIKALKSKLD